MKTGSAVSPATQSRVVSGTLSNGAALAAGQLLAGASFVILARRSAPETFGAFAALYAISLFAGGLMDFGSSQRITRDLAAGRSQRIYLSWLVRRSALQLPFAALLSVGLILTATSKIDGSVVAVLGMQSLGYTVSLGAGAPVRAFVAPSRAAWYVALGNIPIVACAALAPTSSLLITTSLAMFFSWWIATALCLFSTRRITMRERQSSSQNPWADCIPFGLAGVAYTSTNLYVPLVALGGGTFQAGLVAAVQKWIQPLALVPNAYATQMFPAFAASSDDQSAVRLLRSVRGFAVVGGIAILLLILVAPKLVVMLLGESYSDASAILQLYAIALLPVMIAQPLSALLQARHQELFVAVSSGVLALGAIATVFGLAKVVGASAAPITMLSSATILLGLFTKRAQRLQAGELNGEIRRPSDVSR